MKTFFGIFTLALSMGAIASTIDYQTFTYDGSQNSTELILKTEKTHTEYRYEDYRTTCHRTEYRFETRCYPGNVRTSCLPTTAGPVCRTYREPTRCERVNVPYTVSYSCTQTRSIPYEVKDYDVEARVIVDVTNTSSESTSGENIKVKLTGDSLSYEASGSKKFLIVQRRSDIRSSFHGSVKYIDGLLAVELVDADKILKSASINNIVASRKNIEVTLQSTEGVNDVAYSLKIVKKKLIGSEPVLFDRELSKNEIEVKGNAISIDLEKLGVDLDSGKFEIKVTAVQSVLGAILNSHQFSDRLSSEKKLTFKR